MSRLTERLRPHIEQYRALVKDTIAEHGNLHLCDVTVSQAYGGMRGVISQVCETSAVEPDEGLIVRGQPLSAVSDRLPEELFWLLLTGELPDAETLRDIQAELFERATVPPFVFELLRQVPQDSAPMALQSLSLLALEERSKFAVAYHEGITKDVYWEYVLEDALSLLAQMPVVTAAIFRVLYQDGNLLANDSSRDWMGNFAHLLGLDDPTGNLAAAIRLYVTLHSDHGSGNVSANVCHVAGSALSDPFYAVSAGLNGLAGPLHGMAPRDALEFHQQVLEKFGGAPTEDQLKQHVWDTLKSGRVIPGFGHAVLRNVDPRYVACHKFGEVACPDHPLFQVCDLMYKAVPDILKEHGKAKNPYPNVDSVSGTLFYVFGITQPAYYTTIFGISRAIGMCAQMILNRAAGIPITRPKDISTQAIREHLAPQAAG